MREQSRRALFTLLVTVMVATSVWAAEVPPLPTGVPVLLAGHPDLDGERLVAYEKTFAMGRVGKDDGRDFGAVITVGVEQTNVLQKATRDGRQVWRRSSAVRRPGNDQVLASSSIDMDAKSLLPIYAETEQGGTRTTLEYDWEEFAVTKTVGEVSTKQALDLAMLEVGAHDVWLAALPLRSGFRAMIPMVFAGADTKYWAVPKVVGEEAIDVGDGKRRIAWVVELDWWGMGAQNTAENHSLGGGSNGSAGPGGKYWVLKDAVPGTPQVVRIRTEVDPQTESVIQVQ